MIDLGEIERALNRAARELPADELPQLLGIVAEAQARAQARLVAPTPAVVPTERLLTAEQVAEIFRVPVSQIYESARRHRLPCVRIGKYVRFDITAIRQALAVGVGSESPTLRHFPA